MNRRRRVSPPRSKRKNVVIDASVLQKYQPKQKELDPRMISDKPPPKKKKKKNLLQRKVPKLMKNYAKLQDTGPDLSHHKRNRNKNKETDTVTMTQTITIDRNKIMKKSLSSSKYRSIRKDSSNGSDRQKRGPVKREKLNRHQRNKYSHDSIYDERGSGQSTIRSIPKQTAVRSAPKQKTKSFGKQEKKQSAIRTSKKSSISTVPKQTAIRSAPKQTAVRSFKNTPISKQKQTAVRSAPKKLSVSMKNTATRKSQSGSGSKSEEVDIESLIKNSIYIAKNNRSKNNKEYKPQVRSLNKFKKPGQVNNTRKSRVKKNTTKRMGSFKPKAKKTRSESEESPDMEEYDSDEYVHIDDMETSIHDIWKEEEECAQLALEIDKREALRNKLIRKKELERSRQLKLSLQKSSKKRKRAVVDNRTAKRRKI
eukprot:TRINITY_DN8111_c0_g1_i1.p1 TRINITY_DN8111_c0_g1~~TRINITY_DN8111_c0_g1_i1.p1  ORF type:complete len:424 (-),score=99.54 TRINITY_DN8111_c0_g1_i1:58-1329(-)